MKKSKFTEEQIAFALKQAKVGTDLSVFRLPDDLENRSFEALKPYEDQIDALVCAWTAAQYLEGSLAPLGNQISAIWVPRELIK